MLDSMEDSISISLVSCRSTSRDDDDGRVDGVD